MAPLLSKYGQRDLNEHIMTEFLNIVFQLQLSHIFPCCSPLLQPFPPQCTLVQPLWKTVWNMEFPQKTKSGTDLYLLLTPLSVPSAPVTLAPLLDLEHSGKQLALAFSLPEILSS